MANARTNSLLPKKAVQLHVPLSIYNEMIDKGCWPKASNSLVYDLGQHTWYVGPNHPDFEQLTSRFGPDNSQAKTQWQQEWKQRDRAREFLFRKRFVGREDRLWLPGLVGQTEKAREVGALWDRSAKMWYVSVEHNDAAVLAEKYSSSAGIRS